MLTASTRPPRSPREPHRAPVVRCRRPRRERVGEAKPVVTSSGSGCTSASAASIALSSRVGPCRRTTAPPAPSSNASWQILIVVSTDAIQRVALAAVRLEALLAIAAADLIVGLVAEPADVGGVHDHVHRRQPALVPAGEPSGHCGASAPVLTTSRGVPPRKSTRPVTNRATVGFAAKNQVSPTRKAREKRTYSMDHPRPALSRTLEKGPCGSTTGAISSPNYSARRWRGREQPEWETDDDVQ